MDKSNECWLPVPVPSYEGLYKVSSHGRVWSAPRATTPGGILKPQKVNKSGHLDVSLCANGVVERHLVHRLVMEAFVGPCPEGQEVRHLDGNPANNRWAPGGEAETRAGGGNLIYGTPRENVFDAIEHQTHFNASKTHCKHGHEFTPENTRTEYRVGRNCICRVCRTCESGRKKAKREAGKRAA